MIHTAAKRFAAAERALDLAGGNCSSRPLSPPRFSSGHDRSYSESPIVFVQLTVRPFVTPPLSSQTILFTSLLSRCLCNIIHPKHLERHFTPVGSNLLHLQLLRDKRRIYVSCYVLPQYFSICMKRIQRWRKPRILWEHEWTSAFMIQERKKKRHFKLSETVRTTQTPCFSFVTWITRPEIKSSFTRWRNINSPLFGFSANCQLSSASSRRLFGSSATTSWPGDRIKVISLLVTSQNEKTTKHNLKETKSVLLINLKTTCSCTWTRNSQVWRITRLFKHKPCFHAAFWRTSEKSLRCF